MKIAVLSGKGGAGKTTVAVNLALAAGQACYVDCDVEEPNGHLFLNPDGVSKTAVSTLLPQFDAKKCTGCRKCVEFCNFHALIYIKNTPMIFPEVCHSCGGCALVCPEHAISEAPKEIGFVEIGQREQLQVITGRMNAGEASGIPIIRSALKQADCPTTIIDCPPGSACGVMECVSAADYCVLVTEPTAFGFHNFRMVHELVTLLGKPCGVVLNKADGSYPPLEQFCAERNLRILESIPYDPEIAALLSQGQLLSSHSPQLNRQFLNILSGIEGDVT